MIWHQTISSTPQPKENFLSLIAIFARQGKHFFTLKTDFMRDKLAHSKVKLSFP